MLSFQGLRISQSQTRPSKPSTMIESNGSDFPKFDFPEFPNFGSFAKEFEPTGNEKDFFQGKLTFSDTKNVLTFYIFF